MQQASFLNSSLFDIESMLIEHMDALAHFHGGELPSFATQCYMELIRLIGLTIDERGKNETLGDALAFFATADITIINAIDQADPDIDKTDAIHKEQYVGTLLDGLNSIKSFLEAFRKANVSRIANGLEALCPENQD